MLHAQQIGKTYRIGMVEVVSADLNAANLSALRMGLNELGYVEGRNLVLDYRSANGNAALFPGIIAELIGLKVDLIITRGTPAALAAKKATSTIPVVMAGSGDPLLIVDSLARPGGNKPALADYSRIWNQREWRCSKSWFPPLSELQLY